MNKVAAFALQRKNSILSMSEKMFCPPQPLRLVWITPACAGKSSRNETCWHRPWDHPCVCREKRRNSRDPEVWQGSPPPVRGKDTAVQREPFLAGIPPPRMQGKGNFHVVTHTKVGITPARAGKSCPPQAPTFTRQDHPRVCREKSKLFPVDDAVKGSPPRMRGKVSAGKILLHDGGITPAYAGKRARPAFSSA